MECLHCTIAESHFVLNLKCKAFNFFTRTIKFESNCAGKKTSLFCSHETLDASAVQCWTRQMTKWQLKRSRKTTKNTDVRERMYDRLILWSPLIVRLSSAVETISIWRPGKISHHSQSRLGEVVTLSFFFKLSNHDLVLCGSVKVTDRSQPCEVITACTGFEIWREDCHKTGSSHKDRPRKFLPVKCATPLTRTASLWGGGSALKGWSTLGR